MYNYNQGNDTWTEFWDHIQSQGQCCGYVFEKDFFLNRTKYTSFQWMIEFTVHLKYVSIWYFQIQPDTFDLSPYNDWTWSYVLELCYFNYAFTNK